MTLETFWAGASWDLSCEVHFSSNFLKTIEGVVFFCVILAVLSIKMYKAHQTHQHFEASNSAEMLRGNILAMLHALVVLAVAARCPRAAWAALI